MTLDAFLRDWQGTLGQGGALALVVSLAAGVVASAICPCTLPVGLGMAGVVGSSESRARSEGLRIAFSFFAGIVLNLVLLGTLAGHLGGLLSESFGRYWALAMAALSLGGAVVAWRGPRLTVEQLSALRRPGVLGALSYGFAFSLGTSAAPLLLLLAAAAASSSPAWGFATALTFGIGRGLPFLVVGLFSGAIVRLAGLGAWRKPLQVVSALALLLVSFYYARTFVTLA